MRKLIGIGVLISLVPALLAAPKDQRVNLLKLKGVKLERASLPEPEWK